MAFVDLKPMVDSVDDQLSTNSCTAHTVTSALEMLAHKAGKPRQLSRLFNYWCSRDRRGELDRDAGTSLAIACDMAYEYGVPDETL